MSTLKAKILAYNKYIENRNSISNQNDLLTFVSDSVYQETQIRLSVWQIKQCVETFNNYGSLSKERKRRCKDKRDRARTKVISTIENNPNLSIRQIVQDPDIAASYSTVQKILKEEKYFPYKLVDVPLLKPGDKLRRLEFCNKFKSSGISPHKIWFSDEKFFTLNGKRNHQNLRCWAKSRPLFFNELEAHPIKTHVWCGLSAIGIIGPFFFEENVDQFAYQRMIDLEFIPELRKKFGLDPSYYFQQDGATPHCTNYTLELLKVYFGDNLISRRCAFEWPSHSPDLNPLDYFFWGILDDAVKAKKPSSLGRLKGCIIQAINAINVSILPSVIDNFSKRVDLCISQNGSYFTDLL